MTEALKKYYNLIEQRPELFANTGNIKILTCHDYIESFTNRTGVKTGVLYESDYNMLLVDVVQNAAGEIFPYERIIPKNPNSIVSLTFVNGKIALLKQYRHALRNYQYALPRGFGEINVDAQKNCKKEVYEEIGATVKEIKFLGDICPDSGLSGAVTKSFVCYADKIQLTPDYEGINDVLLVTCDEFEDMCARALINDSFTLSTYMLWKISNKL